MRRRRTLAELRTMLSGVDPGLTRLRLATIGTASMMLAAGAMSVVRRLSGQPVTVVLVAALLAMISNLTVREPNVPRMRVTTLLMLGPALVSLAIGTLLAPHRVVADIAFVAVTMVAVYIRRFGPRGFALGMAAFNSFFLTQFLHANIAQLPWLLIAAIIGIGSTLLLRGWVFAERPQRTHDRLLRAFRAHLHVLVQAVADLLTAPSQAVEDKLYDIERRRARLNDTTLLLIENMERSDVSPEEQEGADQDGQDRALALIDAELAVERLAVATERLVQHESPVIEDDRRALLAGLDALEAVSAAGTPSESATRLLYKAQRSVCAPATEPEGHSNRTQRVAFAVIRLADALRAVWRADEPALAKDRVAAGLSADRSDGVGVRVDHSADPGQADSDTEQSLTIETNAEKPQGVALSTRQTLQVGIATSLAIVIGELVSPARWYWAVLTAFIVFVGTNSRSEVLSRGSQRLIGTVGGVVAGMGLAVLVSGHELPALLVMFGCAFLMLYLARISQALMAFWITAVLAVLYGLIGQFSVETLVLRIEETAVGVVMGMLAAYLVLPKRTWETFGEAIDEVVDAVDAVLTISVEKILGRKPASTPGQLTRDPHQALSVLRQRAKPLANPLPWRRGRSSVQRIVRMLTAVEHYARSLARVADRISEPGWAPTLRPAADQVRTNLNALRQVLRRRQEERIISAEDVIDAAEACAAHISHLDHRADLLTATRLLRRIDQVVVKFAIGLDHADEVTRPQPVPMIA